MKKQFIIIATVVAMALSACHINRMECFDPEYQTESSVRDMMAEQGYDAALMTSVGDTQRITYLRFGSDMVLYNEISGGKDSAGMDYGSLRSTNFTMDNATAMLTVTLTPLNDTTYSIDSLTTLFLAKPVQGKERELQRFVAWSLYGFREALSVFDEELTEDIVGIQEELEESELELEEASKTLLEFDTVIVSPGCKAQKSFERLEKKAKELGFASVELHHKPGHRGCTFRCTHAFGSIKSCNSRMGEMCKVASAEGLANGVRHHHKLNLSPKCIFEAHN